MDIVKNSVQVGPQKFKVDAGTKIVFQSQKPISVIGVKFSKVPFKKPKSEVLFTGKKGKLYVAQDDNLDIQCDQDCIWSVDYTHRVERTEVLDPNPVAVTIDAPESVEEKVKRLIRQDRLLRMAEAEEYETFEEADDFDLDDDEELRSPYEIFEQFNDALEESASEKLDKNLEIGPERSSGGASSQDSPEGTEEARKGEDEA